MLLAGNVDQFVEYCNGIPGLLTCCTKSNYKEEIEIKERMEFYNVVEYLIDHNKLVNWSLEMKILAAANLQIPIKYMGLNINNHLCCYRTSSIWMTKASPFRIFLVLARA